MYESNDLTAPVLEGVAQRGQLKDWRVRIFRHPIAGWSILYYAPGSELAAYNSWAEDWGDVMSYVDSDGHNVKWYGGTEFTA